jgi:hypothetical protein
MESDHKPEIAIAEQIAKLDLEVARLTAERDKLDSEEAREVVQRQIDDLAAQARKLRQKAVK